MPTTGLVPVGPTYVDGAAPGRQSGGAGGHGARTTPGGGAAHSLVDGADRHRDGGGSPGPAQASGAWGRAREHDLLGRKAEFQGRSMQL